MRLPCRRSCGVRPSRPRLQQFSKLAACSTNQAIIVESSAILSFIAVFLQLRLMFSLVFACVCTRSRACHGQVAFLTYGKKIGFDLRSTRIAARRHSTLSLLLSFLSSYGFRYQFYIPLWTRQPLFGLSTTCPGNSQRHSLLSKFPSNTLGVCVQVPSGGARRSSRP